MTHFNSVAHGILERLGKVEGEDDDDSDSDKEDDDEDKESEEDKMDGVEEQKKPARTIVRAKRKGPVGK